MGLTLGNRTPRDHWCRLEIARLRKKQFYPAQKKPIEVIFVHLSYRSYDPINCKGA